MRVVRDLDAASQRLAEFFAAHRRVVVMTGAGISTDSGIPDYRGARGSYSRGHRPMRQDEFASSSALRRRYWCRGFFGYKNLGEARPNTGHLRLAAIEKLGQQGAPPGREPARQPRAGPLVTAVITQNVDGLHQRAGSSSVIELHGSLHRIKCSSCGVPAPYSREEMQEVLFRLNQEGAGDSLALSEPGGAGGGCAGGHRVSRFGSGEQPRLFGAGDTLRSVGARSFFPVNADGDAEITDEGIISRFEVPACGSCGADMMQPDVVFFGGTIPKPRWEAVGEVLKQGRALLVLGTTLQVGSAWRIVRLAARRGLPIAIVNLGETRASSTAILSAHERAEAEAARGLSSGGLDGGSRRPAAVVEHLEVGCSEVLDRCYELLLRKTGELPAPDAR